MKLARQLWAAIPSQRDLRLLTSPTSLREADLVPLPQGEQARRPIASRAGVIAAITIFHVSRGLGVETAPPSLLLSVVGLLVGAALGRVPPNALVGVRTPWSLTSRRAWDRSNRLAGRLLAASGLAGLVACLVDHRPRRCGWSWARWSYRSWLRSARAGGCGGAIPSGFWYDEPFTAAGRACRVGV